jgi:NAD(P)-dependent dehydrogenase (short-subunit alcohol dehydrogenase family)
MCNGTLAERRLLKNTDRRKAMPGRLAGKVAVVTGATAGIGLGIAKRFVKEGATVIFNARRADRGTTAQQQLRELAQGGEVHFVQADVSVREQVEAVIDRALNGFGRIDALVNNAQRLVTVKPIMVKPDEDYQNALDGGFFASKWAMQRAFPAMRDQGGGSVVNMTSGWAWQAPVNASDYAATKAAIEALTRSAANEWGRYNINVNVIAPYAKSKSWDKYAAANPDAARLSQASNPLKRAGDPEFDLGNLALGLVTEEARFITGQTFDGSGGAFYLRRTHSSTETWTGKM